MKFILGALAFLFASLWAKLTPGPKKSWIILYRGSFGNRQTPPFMTVSGDMISAQILFKADTGHQYVAQGAPGDALPPTSSILIELQEGDTLRHCLIDLSTLFTKPLQGYIEILADRNEVKVRAFQYTWGRSLSFDTGQTHRSVKRLSEKAYNWETSSGNAENLHARGLSMADDVFNARFRDH